MFVRLVLSQTRLFFQLLYNPLQLLENLLHTLSWTVMGRFQKQNRATNIFDLDMCCHTVSQSDPIMNTIVRSLLNFFSTCDLPKFIQTNQGSNFMSKLVAQVISSLSIKHQKSSAYHPESQGTLERFHHTLKSMLQNVVVRPEESRMRGYHLFLLQEKLCRT